MTFEGARREAIRRSVVMGKTHYVITTPNGFLVMADVPRKWMEAVVSTWTYQDAVATGEVSQ